MGFERRGFGGPREMHEATCADCGKECEVPFKPTEGKPVYCRQCYQKQKELAMHVTFDLERNGWLDPRMISKVESVSVYRQVLKWIRATDRYMLELTEDEDNDL